jgi:hypothetical protein
MDALSKILALLFSLITMLGIIPKNIPARVILPELKKEEILMTVDSYDFKYEDGKFSLAFGGNTMFADAVSEVKLDGSVISSADYTGVILVQEKISDLRGEGVRITATLTDDDKPTMKQNFTFYEGAKYFLVNTELEAESGEVASNYIAPIVVRNGNIQNANPRYTNFLEVPFDNDGWVEFETSSIMENALAHEVGAFFTPDNKDGLIIGSVTHDTWKSAVEYKSKAAAMDELYVYSGANTALTRDQSPHGTVHGESISSAAFFVGFYDKWKEGMTEFARINTTFTPKRQSVGNSNPIGWNSWGSIQSDINYEGAVATSDYIKENFQDIWKNEENIVYVNLDSYWDNLSYEQLCSFVKHCEENGQVAGVYFSPFVMWWDEYGMQNNYVADTGISFNDIRLKKADGTYYGNDIDGCYPMDVTHPAAQLNFKNNLERLLSCGFKYIKLDFLVHGSLEGDYYDDSIQTGIQAYNYAMNKVCEILGDDVFINLAMAPIFPYNYANGRRLCCDTYYAINETEYMMNSLTYGFWQSELYDWIDPDHIVVWGKDGKANERAARSRLLSGIVTGGSFLTGDNYVNPAKYSEAAHKRYNELFTNEKLIEVLKIGEPFDAVLSEKLPYAADIFTLENEGKTYVAMFNYSKVTIKTLSVDVPDNSAATNLFTGKTKMTVGNKLIVTLQPSDSVIFEITAK